MNKKNNGSLKTVDIYLSTHLLWHFLFELALSSVSKLFISPNIDFLSFYLDSFTCYFAFKGLEEKIRVFLYSFPLLSMFIFCPNILTKSPRFKFLNLLSYIHRLDNYQVIYLDLNPQSKK